MRSKVFSPKISLNCERVRLGVNRHNESQCHVLECECEEGFECEWVLDRCEQLRLVVRNDQMRLIANGCNLSYVFGDHCDLGDSSEVQFEFASHLTRVRV